VKVLASSVEVATLMLARFRLATYTRYLPVTGSLTGAIAVSMSPPDAPTPLTALGWPE